ncbi:MAG: YtxH domain-containing protein [Microscillaceae bacterium]|jgi:gas vesicle protein|nr:YtxH domain-containing protein [Microscillaceae bacterium]
MNKSTSFLLGLITGAAVGTLVGVLFAPSEGKQTRNRLSYRLSRLQNDMQELLTKKQEVMSEAKNQGDEVTNTAKRKAQQLQDQMDAILEKNKPTKRNSSKK